MKRPEDQIQRAVLQHLKVRGAANVFAFHVPNGGKRRPKEAAIMKGLGVRAGVPDLIIIMDGKTFALELKTEKGKVTLNQFQTIKDMNIAGATAAVVHGLDAALAWLEEQGILKGKAA